jgi:hypothetical protein
VWAYVDESGNTGNRIFDPEQPFFVTAAMATKANFDLVRSAEVAAIARKVGAPALHADAELLLWPGEREPYSISRAPGSKFRMTPEELSPGLQVVDVVLWLFNRSLAGKDLGPRGGHLLNVMFKRGRQADMSFDGVGKDVDRRYQEVLTERLTAEQEAGGREMMETFEQHRIQAMAEHSARKKGSSES